MHNIYKQKMIRNSKHTILLGLTTTPKSDWREKTREIDELGLKEIALFPTFLETQDRKELYALLEKTGLKKIPHVHLRDDMEEWELDLFYNKYGARLFNIHYNQFCIDFMLNSKYRKNIFLENLSDINEFYVENVPKCGGICLDFSHWNGSIFLKNSSYGIMEQLIRENKVGCCHISAESKEVWHYINPKNGKRTPVKDDHWLSDLSQLDYVKKFINYLPEYISIELENSFEEQLKVKNYLDKIINT
jgi:hypothetical protein